MGDDDLAKHLQTASQRHLFTSKTTQNALIECCGEEILSVILSRVREAKFYSCGFDETVDVSHISQLSLFLRYVWRNCVREDFVGFLEARRAAVNMPEDTEEDMDDPSAPSTSENTGDRETSNIEPSLTGFKLGQVVVQELDRFELDAIGIGTDGCSVNTSETVGAVQEVQKKAVHAVRCSCYSHQLNLTLSKTSKVQAIRNSFGIMGEVIFFFTASSKRNAVLKAVVGSQLTQLCDTRWVERHDAVLGFKGKILKIAEALEVVSEWTDVPGDPSPPKARSLLSSIMDSQFIVSLCIFSTIVTLTEPLGRLFQTESFGRPHCCGNSQEHS